MSLLFNDILSDVSYVLVEPVVSATLGTSVPAGTFSVTPSSMIGIYVGALLIVDRGMNVQEVVTVSVVTPTSFTATFANAHSLTASVVAATFLSGQTDIPLFTQQEMIGYLTEVQNDFLLKVRTIFAVSTQPLVIGNRFYPQPATAIRLERVAVNPNPAGNGVLLDLYETTQSNLDLLDPTWQQKQGPPESWFRDQIDTAKFGINPLPSTNLTAELWYSIRGNTTGNTLTTVLLVPDIFGHFLKYGVLARAFSKDGEMRDPQRADYCQRRFNLGVLLGVKFMEGAGVNMPQGAAGSPDFSPMPVPARQ